MNWIEIGGADSMHFSVGIMDTLFGRRVTLEIPDSFGNIVTRSVTQKWYNQVQSDVSAVTGIVKVHMLDMHKGYQLIHWIIGNDIEQNTVLQYMDEDTGDLYAIYYLELDESRLQLISRRAWESAHRKFCYFKQEAGQSIQGI
ncbi:MAG TPA: hypothetical protein VNT57_04585 [Desulfobacteria bacterium]|nr:hypothetical protein [Desulfobacteria bacterium]